MLLRVTTVAGQEFRTFLTRRFLKGLWPLIQRTIDSKVALKAPSPETRSDVIAFEQQKAVAEADFSTPFVDEPARTFPLGETPYVAKQASVRLDGETFRLALNPDSGQGFEIGLDDKLMHSLCKLIEQAARSAEWDLPFFAAPSGAAGLTVELTGTPPPKHLLN